MTEASSPQVKSALRTLDILEILTDTPRPLAAQEIAEMLSIPVSSLSYLLATLCQRGYLTRNPDRRYVPGPALERFREETGWQVTLVHAADRQKAEALLAANCGTIPYEITAGGTAP